MLSDEYMELYELEKELLELRDIKIKSKSSLERIGQLYRIFSLKCDMDTLCAIGGGIAEEFYKGIGFDNEKLLRIYLDDRLYYPEKS